MILRLLTLVLVFLQVGVPFITSSTNPHFVRVYQEAINWGNPWAQAAWILWGLWMVWPLFNFFRLAIKYPF